MTEPVRLAKRLAELTACSRREAELYIAGGWVRVDGKVVELPQFMVTNQKVELDAAAKAVPVEPVTILLHQPADLEEEAVAPLLCADTQAADDHSHIRVLQQHFVRMTPCLPLEPNASGMSVFTQDFRVSRKLVDGAATVEQEYVAEISGELSEEGLKLLNHGLTFNDRPLSPAKVSRQSETRLRFALKGVRPGQIAFMCESVGLELLSLRRLRIGRLSMGKLPMAQWRYLAPYEKF
ncbi:MAG: RNA-binding protein [Gammaproteobacteria bacterium]|nr:RNA-binding protein [Gammaproteobacteria bacterium]MBU1624119.1 RNA-binding protein [Gammaproteobacteria bacterium]MBU1981847.1 RNA-binding protein [Gammaproteobacteria bacterium]